MFNDEAAGWQRNVGLLGIQRLDPGHHRVAAAAGEPGKVEDGLRGGGGAGKVGWRKDSPRSRIDPSGWEVKASPTVTDR